MPSETCTADTISPTEAAESNSPSYLWGVYGALGFSLLRCCECMKLFELFAWQEEFNRAWTAGKSERSCHKHWNMTVHWVGPVEFRRRNKVAR